MASTLTVLHLHELRLRIAKRIEQLPQERQKHLSKLASRITGFLQSIMEIADSLPQDKILETLKHVTIEPLDSIYLCCRFTSLTEVSFYLEGDETEIRIPYNSGSLKKLSDYLSQKYNAIVSIPVAKTLEAFSITLTGQFLCLSLAINENIGEDLIYKNILKFKEDIADLGLEAYDDLTIVDIVFT